MSLTFFFPLFSFTARRSEGWALRLVAFFSLWVRAERKRSLIPRAPEKQCLPLEKAPTPIPYSRRPRRKKENGTKCLQRLFSASQRKENTYLREEKEEETSMVVPYSMRPERQKKRKKKHPCPVLFPCGPEKKRKKKASIIY
jgi:hypothetical protein